ncbi:MAG TPA: adenosine deaminase [Bryobacteraceae bacterium]|nr:adenosine deaminase [Bryobacteraceae bacterium]
MKKAELHIHLEGSIGPDTLIEIDPSLTREEIETNLTCTSFPQFLQGYIWVNKKLQKPEHYALATRHLLDSLAAQDVTYAEITLSAGVVIWKEQDLAPVYDAVWHESQRSTIQTFWILDAIRQFGPEKGMDVARFAATHRDDGVVAYGIGGDEVRGPAHWFSDVFAYARDSGLRLVAHAGETAGPESVWGALAIGAERIGHGIAAAQDPRLVAELRDRNIPLEVCISSNICTGAVASLDAHPIRALYDAGVPITVHTDDPAFFRTTLDREYALAQGSFGIPAEELAANSFRYAFQATQASHFSP